MATTRSFYRIDLPSAPFSSDVHLVEVSPYSRKALRVHVERFARYFLREMHFGSIQFEAAEVPSSVGFVPYRAFLFVKQGYYIGAGCFRQREGLGAHIWTFDWLWLHPFCRHQGNLTQAWPKLVSLMGEFTYARPLSLAMERFLVKIGWPEQP